MKSTQRNYPAFPSFPDQAGVLKAFLFIATNQKVISQKTNEKKWKYEKYVNFRLFWSIFSIEIFQNLTKNKQKVFFSNLVRISNH